MRGAMRQTGLRACGSSKPGHQEGPVAVAACRLCHMKNTTTAQHPSIPYGLAPNPLPSRAGESPLLQGRDVPDCTTSQPHAARRTPHCESLLPYNPTCGTQLSSLQGCSYSCQPQGKGMLVPRHQTQIAKASHLPHLRTLTLPSLLLHARTRKVLTVVRYASDSRRAQRRTQRAVLLLP